MINRVEKAIKELDYQYNLMAGSIRSKKTRTIGLIIPDISNLFFAALVTNIEDIFFANNYNIMMCNSYYDIRKESEILKMMLTKKVDGIIIVPESVDGQYIEKIRRLGTPIVVLERMIPGIEVDTVLIDNRKVSYEATEYLIKLGHVNIGYIDRKVDKYHSLDRKKGYEDALNHYGLSLDNNLITRGGFSCEDGFKATNLLLRNKNISAILTFGDFAALGAIRAIIDKGLKVPEDISVVGYTDMPISAFVVPKLTTIHYPIKKIAKSAGELLLLRIKEPDIKEIKNIVLEPRLVIRESTSFVKAN